MNKFNVIDSKFGHGLRRSGTVVLVLALSVLLSGCYFMQAKTYFNKFGASAPLPWWCAGGSAALTSSECLQFSLWMDAGINGVAYKNVTVADFTLAGGAEIADRPANIGVPFANAPITAAFEPGRPNVLLYAGNSATSRVVGIAWAVSGLVGDPPAGFAGDRDVWTFEPTSSTWWLPAWVVRGHQNHPNVFAAQHPCLTSSGSNLTSTTDACYIASHTVPLQIVVVNDDGISAPGIDALVEGLYTLPPGTVNIRIVAPAGPQSGAGSKVTKKPYVISGAPATTVSGRLGTAVSSTDPSQVGASGSPADSVLYAVKNLSLSPDIVLSGINHGQNLGTIGHQASGTVGAARMARSNGVPAIASSQGNPGGVTDFPSGATATLALLEEWRLGRTPNATGTVQNINIPTCTSGSIRGTLKDLAVSQVPPGAIHINGVPNCNSSTTGITDDLNAYLHGFTGIADMGFKKPPSWP